VIRLAGLVIAVGAGVVIAACAGPERIHYQKAMDLMHGSNYGEALIEFDKVLNINPASNMALFGKARCLHQLNRFEDALPLFEQFLSQTDAERGTHRDERCDEEFYRDRCKQELGMEVPQNEDAIPPPPMGE